jgi:hypothetical protein
MILAEAVTFEQVIVIAFYFGFLRLDGSEICCGNVGRM